MYSSTFKRDAKNTNRPPNKRQKIDENIKDEISHLPARSIPLLKRIHCALGTYSSVDGIITGECAFCSRKLRLLWLDWRHHFLDHTMEELYYCVECKIGIEHPLKHEQCPNESIINVYGDLKVGERLEGFICKRCDYLQIKNDRLKEHLKEEHPDASFEADVKRVTLLPDVRPQTHIIATDFAFVPLSERFRCGVGNCIFHGENAAAYTDHFGKTHSTIKTYYCRHCTKIINRMSRRTVPLQEVLQHINLHSSHVHQCFYCDVVEISKDAIQTHLTAVHPDLVAKYWHNKRNNNSPDGIENCELIEIALDCSICDERVEGKTAAIDHFRKQHSGCQFNFKAMKFIKTGTKCVMCTIDDSACYREVFGCGICMENFTEKAQWLGHFNGAHPQETLTARHHLKWMKSIKHETLDQLAYQRLMLFSCASCKNAKKSYYATVDECYDHWKCTHVGSYNKSFQFHLTKLVACHYCNTIATFHDLKAHITNKHTGQPFVALKAFEFRKICALCNFSTDMLAAAAAANDDFIEHFSEKHSLAMQSNVFNPIPLRDLELSQIRQISVHKKVKCAYCGDIFPTKMAFGTHHSNEHSKLEQTYVLIEDTENVQLIGSCCRSRIDPKSFFKHLAHHKHALTCNKCSFETTDTFAFVCHQVLCDEREQTTVPQKYRSFLELRYWRSELIFENGLVINKFNTIGTQINDAEQFQRFVEDLIKKKMRKYFAEKAIKPADSDDEYHDGDDKAAAAAAMDVIIIDD